MYSNDKKLEALERIIKSRTFAKSTTTAVLLSFLVNSSIQGKKLTAFDIGEELFGSKLEHDKTENNARVNIYHLRKKLSKYYEQEGKDDTIRIYIDKGHYELRYEPLKKPKSKRTRFYLLPAILLICLVVVFVIIAQRSRTKDQIWSDTFKNGHASVLYLGDLFGYRDTTSFGNKGWIRDYNINSTEEFENALKNLPGNPNSIKPATYNYVTFLNAVNIRHLTRHFVLNNSDFVIRRASKINIENIKDQNLIYTGSFRTNPIINRLFHRMSKNVHFSEVAPYTLQYNNGNDIDTTILMTAERDTKEYALAAHFNGANHTSHHLFFSNHGLGLKGVIEYFTDPEILKGFSKKYLTESTEFVALFYVEGQDKTNLKMELVFVDDNNPN